MPSEDEEPTLRREAIRWALLFACLVGGMSAALWWSTSAVQFSASRIEGTTRATYRIHGHGRDAATGKPVSWAEIFDDPTGYPPLFRSSAGFDGKFELLTIAEPHAVRVAALGYAEARVEVGRRWFLWMPKGGEPLAILLHRETSSTPPSR